MSPAATVLVVDDHPVVRRGLAAMLGLEDWVGRVVEAGSVREGAAVGATERADVAVVDLGLPDGDGVELVRRLRRAPGCPVLVLTMTRDEGVVRACLAAGAGGYLLKDSPPDAVVRAARTVLDGGLVLGPEIARAALPTGRPARLPAPLDRLSPADLRLLGLLADGRTNPRIAAELGVAEKTVRNRVSALLGLLGVEDRVQAALLAREKGLPTAITLPDDGHPCHARRDRGSSGEGVRHDERPGRRPDDQGRRVAARRDARRGARPPAGEPAGAGSRRRPVRPGRAAAEDRRAARRHLRDRARRRPAGRPRVQLLLDRIDLVLARWQVLLDTDPPEPTDGSAPPKRVLRVTGDLPQVVDALLTLFPSLPSASSPTPGNYWHRVAHKLGIAH